MISVDAPEAYTALITTRAIRRFRNKRVPTEDLRRMLFAATRAPSGSNLQPFHFVVLRDGPSARVARDLLGRTTRQAWSSAVPEAGVRFHSSAATLADGPPDSPRTRLARTMQAFVDNFERTPVIVLACLTPRSRPISWTEGASIFRACHNLLLAARTLGYGGVLVMWHLVVEDELKRLLSIPDEVTIAATVALGDQRAITARCAGSRSPTSSSRTPGRRHPIGRSILQARGSRRSRRARQTL